MNFKACTQLTTELHEHCENKIQKSNANAIDEKHGTVEQLLPPRDFVKLLAGQQASGGYRPHTLFLDAPQLESTHLVAFLARLHVSLVHYIESVIAVPFRRRVKASLILPPNNSHWTFRLAGKLQGPVWKMIERLVCDLVSITVLST